MKKALAKAVPYLLGPILALLAASLLALFATATLLACQLGLWALAVVPVFLELLTLGLIWAYVIEPRLWMRRVRRTERDIVQHIRTWRTSSARDVRRDGWLQPFNRRFGQTMIWADGIDSARLEELRDELREKYVDDKLLLALTFTDERCCYRGDWHFDAPLAIEAHWS